MSDPKVILVVGIGNPLRGDDGVGAHVVNEIASMTLPNVKTVAVHQLLPELAAELGNTRLMILIDAMIVDQESESTVSWERVKPACDRTTLSHVVTPSLLLSLTESLFGRAPETWLITIPICPPGFGWQLGESLRDRTQGAIESIRDRLLCGEPK
jgi:hydrogenase maturation protease